MKTINTLKIMTDNEKERNKQRKNTNEEQAFLNKAHNFVETYVMPKINISDIIGTSKSDNLLYDDMKATAVDMTIMLAQVNEDNKAPNMLQDNEIDFINKSDVKLKKDIANRIKEYTIKKYTYEDKVNTYIVEYIEPLLKDLDKEKTIIFDSNIIELVKKYIYHETKESIGYSIFKYLYDEDYTNDWNFLFNDNKNAKNEFVGIVKDFLIKYYEKIDIKKVDKLDIEQLLKADAK